MRELPIFGQPAPATERRHPDWIRSKVPGGDRYRELKRLMRDKTLNTVCEEARCPNIGECWDQGTATVMILGDTCTRACGFCAVKTGRPDGLDLDEPRRVAEALASLNLDHVVVTSVARDDLADGGAAIFAATIRELRALAPDTGVEVLIPDFDGREEPLRAVMEAAPDIVDHNLETVPRLYKQARPGSDYMHSLKLLQEFKKRHPKTPTKSGLMLGLGENDEEILQVMRDMRAHDVEMLTIGQYLQPSEHHLPVLRYVHPDTFKMFEREAYAMGFHHAAVGAMVRSSYHADEQAHAASLSAAG